MLTKIKVLSKKVSVNHETFQPELTLTIVFPLEAVQDNSVRLSKEKMYEYIGKEIEEAIKNFDMEYGQELQQTDAYEQGKRDCFIAEIHGEVAVNPYDPETEDWQDWEDGFYDAQWELFDL